MAHVIKFIGKMTYFFVILVFLYRLVASIPDINNIALDFTFYIAWAGLWAWLAIDDKKEA